MEMRKLLEKLFSRPAVVGFLWMRGYRYPNTSVTEINPHTGKETLLSLITRSQNRLRDPNELIKPDA